MEIKIKTLTPLWTGDVDGKCTRIKETGIIGSLRWWYEALVRGLGGYACDPTSDERCELSGKEKNDEQRMAKMCPVCQLFGCGGWKKRFRLRVSCDDKKAVPLQLATLDSKDKFNHWWLSETFGNAFSGTIPFGNITFDFIFARNSDFDEQITALLTLMANFGAIGAKPQYGFGQFDWNEKISNKEAIGSIRDFINNRRFRKDSNRNKWYSLSNFWFYEPELSEHNKLIKRFKNANIVGSSTIGDNYLPVSFDIRYKIPRSEDKGLRSSFQQKHGKHETRRIFGTLKDDKLGSRIFVSHLFKRNVSDDNYNLRVWGFTDKEIGDEIGDEIERIFELSKAPHMIWGNDLLEGGKTE